MVSDRTDSVVVSIGGSILVPGNNDSEYIARLAEMLKGLADGTRLAVVCGGGKTARYYAEVGGALGGDTYQLDILGIGATRLNAQLLSLALGDMPDRVPETVEETAEKAAPGRIAVMGGTEPGHTTDAVAAMVAKAMKADRIVNATSVDAVYTDDPRKNPEAKRIPRMTVSQLGDIVYKEHGASKSSVFDPLGVRIAEENRIDIMMVDGRDLVELRKAILDKTTVAKGEPAPVFGQVQWSVDVVIGGQKLLYKSLIGKLKNVPNDHLIEKINSINDLKKATGIFAGCLYVVPPVSFIATILSTYYLKVGARDMTARIPERLNNIDRIIKAVDASGGPGHGRNHL